MFVKKAKLREKKSLPQSHRSLVGDSEYEHSFITQRSYYSHIADIKSQINHLIIAEGGMLGSENKLCQDKRYQENLASMGM